jgi:hypothetical protein
MGPILLSFLVLQGDADLLVTLQSVEKFKALEDEWSAFSVKQYHELAKLRKEPPTAENKERIARLERAIYQRQKNNILLCQRAQQIYLDRLRQTYGREAVDAVWAWLKKAKGKGKGP